jgi:hypothetical protein
MKKILLAFITFISMHSFADNGLQATYYSKKSYCELSAEGDSNTLLAEHNDKSQKWQNISKTENLSKFRSKYYCITSNNESSSVYLYNKLSGEMITFKNFTAMTESPNGDFIALAETARIEDNVIIEKIHILSKNGKKPIGHHFDEKIPSDQFAMSFSFDSDFLNFFSIKEADIAYNSLQIKSGKIFTNLANKDLTYGGWGKNLIEEGSALTQFTPINNKEYVAQTDLGDVIYIADDKISWKVQDSEGTRDSVVLGVGSVYVVVFKPSEGILLYRRADGEKFKAIESKNTKLSSGYTIISSNFISSNKFIMLAMNNNDGKLYRYALNLNTKKIKHLKDSNKCGIDVDCN